jgi:hypothetical protein
MYVFSLCFATFGGNWNFPTLFFICWDAKSNIFMYKRDLICDWSSFHVTKCGWYLDYPKDSTHASKVAHKGNSWP